MLTASPVDYHCDHEATSVLVRDACFRRSGAELCSGSAPPLSRIPHLYFMDPTSGVDRDSNPHLPDFYVDVAATFAMKQAMLACHASQRSWLRKQHGIETTWKPWSAGRARWAAARAGNSRRASGGTRATPTRKPQVLEEMVGVYCNLRVLPPLLKAQACQEAGSFPNSGRSFTLCLIFSAAGRRLSAICSGHSDGDRCLHGHHADSRLRK